MNVENVASLSIEMCSKRSPMSKLEIRMNAFAKGVVAAWLGLIAALVRAATEVDKAASEPTVSLGWVVLFVLVFVGICAFIGIAAVRADRKSKEAAKE